jgi:hypothetical protein
MPNDGDADWALPRPIAHYVGILAFLCSNGYMKNLPELVNTEI